MRRVRPDGRGDNFNPRGSQGAATRPASATSRLDTNFNPRGSQGAATYFSLTSAASLAFQSTRLAGSRDWRRAAPPCYPSSISIHAARREPRPRSRFAATPGRYFNPRGSQGAATSRDMVAATRISISIHAARREPRLVCRCRLDPEALISIHAARREPRPRLGRLGMRRDGISIHAARREPRRHVVMRKYTPPSISIHAARREPRLSDAQQRHDGGHISIHAARREPRLGADAVYLLGEISIHAARREPRRNRSIHILRLTKFQSTRLAGSRDSQRLAHAGVRDISIHAARREPRRRTDAMGNVVMRFQSTRLAGSRDLAAGELSPHTI